MKKTLKNALVIMLVAGLCLSFGGIATADEPSYGEITLLPEEPTRLSEVRFTVDITGENIEEVRVTVEECNEMLCYVVTLNESMENIEGTNTWESTLTLEHDDTIEGHSWLVIKSGGIWYDFKGDKSKWTNFTVVPGDDGEDGNGGNGGNGNGGNGSGDTPGFEITVLLISLVLALFIYKKKRMR